MSPESVGGSPGVPSQQQRATGGHEGTVEGSLLPAGTADPHPIDVEGHPLPIVAGGQVCPCLRAVAVVGGHLGGSGCPVCAEGEEEAGVLLAAELQGTDTQRPALVAG